MKGYIYKWENKINGKVYIGQTMNVRGYKERWSQHISLANTGKNLQRFQRAIAKYGSYNFDKIILEEIDIDNKRDLSNELDRLEIMYIDKYNSFRKGYNSTKGGDFNVYNSGSEVDVENAKMRQMETRARNQIYKSISIKKNKYGKIFKLPNDINLLNELYFEFDVKQECNYKIEYINIVHHKSKTRHKDYGKTLFDRNLNICSLDCLCSTDILEIKNKTSKEINIDNIDIDFFDKSIVKQLLLFKISKCVNFKSFCSILYLDNLIDRINLTERQKEIFINLKKDKSQTEISKIIGISKSGVGVGIDAICNKIIEKHEEQYEEWYYLNIVKSKYKKCYKCGEIKILKSFHKNGRGGNGNICKYCRSLEYKKVSNS